MSNQLPLDWQRTHAHRNDPATSHEAAESAREMAARHRAIVLEVVRRAGVPLSAEEISALCELDRLQVMKRVSDLKGAGVLRVAEREYRNDSGRRADCYELAA